MITARDLKMKNDPELYVRQIEGWQEQRRRRLENERKRQGVRGTDNIVYMIPQRRQEFRERKQTPQEVTHQTITWKGWSTMLAVGLLLLFVLVKLGTT